MMLNETTLPFVVIGAAAILFVLFYFRTFITFVSGSWYEQKEPGGPIQEIHLSQFGPWVWGWAKVPGGQSLFRGWFNGSVLKLRRRDHGAAYFQHLGFPEAVVPTLNGSEMARAELRFNKAKQLLEGDHYPQKIDISRTRPPKVMGRVYITPTPRTWVRNPKQFPSIPHQPSQPQQENGPHQTLHTR